MAAMTDHELLAILARDAGGEGARVLNLVRTPLAGGFVSKLVERLDLVVATRDGQVTASYVRKSCAAHEVRALRVAAAAPGATAAPELVAAWSSDAAPHDQDENGFVSPFYPGEALHFGDAIPSPVVVSLARLHAASPEGPETDWAWRFDAARVEGLRAFALRTLDGSTRFRERTPDHAAWRARLDAASAAPALHAAAETLPRALTHGDMHPGNIVRRADGSPVIIDWGNACLAPPMLDLANLVEIESDDWRLYWQAYRAAGGTLEEAASRAAFWWARAIAGLMYAPWAAENSDRAPDLIVQMEVATAELALRL
jgi:hypothetical protein